MRASAVFNVFCPSLNAFASSNDISISKANCSLVLAPWLSLMSAYKWSASHFLLPTLKDDNISYIVSNGKVAFISLKYYVNLAAKLSIYLQTSKLFTKKGAERVRGTGVRKRVRGQVLDSFRSWNWDSGLQLPPTCARAFLTYSSYRLQSQMSDGCDTDYPV